MTPCLAALVWMHDTGSVYMSVDLWCTDDGSQRVFHLEFHPLLCTVEQVPRVLASPHQRSTRPIPEAAREEQREIPAMPAGVFQSLHSQTRPRHAPQPARIRPGIHTCMYAALMGCLRAQFLAFCRHRHEHFDVGLLLNVWMAPCPKAPLEVAIHCRKVATVSE